MDAILVGHHRSLEYTPPHSRLEKVELFLGLLACFLMCFKVTLGYIGIIPLILLLCVYHRAFLVEAIRNEQILRTFVLFACIVLLTSIYGINILRSLQHIGTLIFFPLTMVVFFRLSSRFGVEPFMKALLYGLSTSCVFKGIEILFPSVKTGFFGAVSQSGQIALLIIPLAYFFVLLKKESVLKQLFSVICLVLIGTVFLLNLKRGPWIGAFAAAIVFCAMYNRKFLGVVILSSLLLFGWEPLRERLLLSEAHFFIPGGRNAIWDIGSELFSRYPLGIGFENSGFLRSFSSEIPWKLKHFHNNFLNIAVEAGWLGVTFFFVWLFSIATQVLKTKNVSDIVLAHSIGCGLLAWQVAGLVEYNFGDSAVVTIAYILIGILLTLTASRQVSTSAA